MSVPSPFPPIAGFAVAIWKSTTLNHSDTVPQLIKIHKYFDNLGDSLKRKVLGGGGNLLISKEFLFFIDLGKFKMNFFHMLSAE